MAWLFGFHEMTQRDVAHGSFARVGFNLLTDLL